jgi:hypothetical protein
MYAPWVITGETGSSSPGRDPTQNPTRARPHLATTRDPPLVRDLGHQDARHRHPRRRLLGRVPPPRGPTLALTHHDRGSLRLGRGGAGGDRRSHGWLRRASAATLRSRQSATPNCAATMRPSMLPSVQPDHGLRAKLHPVAALDGQQQLPTMGSTRCRRRTCRCTPAACGRPGPKCPSHAPPDRCR